MRFICLVFLALASLAGRPAAAAAPPQPEAAATLTPAQAQAVLDVLQDDKKRTQFEAVLQSMIRAAPTVAPHSVTSLASNSVGAELLVQGESWAQSSARQLRSAVTAVGGLAQVWTWLATTVQSPDALATLAGSLWKLAVILAVSLAAEWAVIRLLASFRRILVGRVPFDPATPEPEAEAPGAETPPGQPEAPPGQHRRLSVAWRMLRRLPFVLLALLLDLVPIAAFAALGNALLALPLGITANDRLVVVAVVGAYVVCRVVLCLTRAIVAPDHPSMRLVRCTDDTASYVFRWVRRISTVAVAGYAVAEVALLFGLSRPAHDVLIKLVALAVHLMLVVVVLQVRHGVEARLRPRKHATGVIASLQYQFAHRWHHIAIFYNIALWLVVAAEIRDGYVRLLHFFLVTTGTLLVARLVAIVVLGALDRALRTEADGVSEKPSLEQRIIQYYPLIRASLVALIMATTAIGLLEVWGFSPLTWFTVGKLGARLVSAVLTSGLTVVIAVVVWEVVNASVESKVTALARAAQTARAARLRTLLPMLRTTLAVALVIMAGLIVLSQIGVNIAPLLAGAGVLGVAIGFGSQKLVQDLITGLFLLLENTMQVGDVVTLASLTGTVEYLSIRTIRLRALDGSMHIIPFSSVTTVTNQTRDFSYALVDLPIGLDEEPDRVAELLSELVRTMRREPRWEQSITADLEVMGVYAFTDTNWTMRVRIRTLPSQRWAVNREFNRRVKYCFDQNAVQSPITSYRVQGWLPPGSERAIPKPPPAPALPTPPPALAPAPLQDAAQ